MATCNRKLGKEFYIVSLDTLIVVHCKNTYFVPITLIEYMKNVNNKKQVFLQIPSDSLMAISARLCMA